MVEDLQGNDVYHLDRLLTVAPVLYIFIRAVDDLCGINTWWQNVLESVRRVQNEQHLTHVEWY